VKPDAKPARPLRVLLAILAGLVVVFALLIRYAYLQTPSPGAKVSLNAVYEFADRGEIVSATLYDEDARIVGQRCIRPVFGDKTLLPEPPAEPSATPRCIGRVLEFHSSYPASDVATQQLIQRIGQLQPPSDNPDENAGPKVGAKVVVDKQTAKAIAKLVATFLLPLLILANLFGLIFLSSGGDRSMADIAGFGTIKRKRERSRNTGSGVTFADVAGAEEAVAELREVVDYLSEPEKFQAYGASPPKGVLLFGPPGCGKTLLARAVAGESNVPFFSISGAEFVESLVGVGAARVRDLFSQVREQAPAIVFIDEFDAVGRRRSGEGNSGGEREQTVNQLLVELDGFEVSSGIVLMGATNRPDILDPALLRPGRFDRHVTLQPPDVNGREAILKLHAAGKPIAPGVDFSLLARRTPGFTGADLANVINEGALLAIREGKGLQIEGAQLTEAIHRVLHGPQRRGRILRPDERRRLAYHEAGHALVAAALGRESEVQRVSIVARGRGLSSVLLDQAERVVLTASEMGDELAMAVSGIATERLVFGESSTTAKDDINKATDLARHMVGVYGMSPRLGLVRMIRLGDGYLGEEGAPEVLSGQTLGEFESEVRRLIAAAEQAASDILAANRSRLDEVVTVLEEKETLEGAELAVLLTDLHMPDSKGPRAKSTKPRVTTGVPK
jgi:cell division protease FtsH